MHLAFVFFQKTFDSIENCAFLNALDNPILVSRYFNLKHSNDNVFLQLIIDEDKKPAISLLKED